jgi:hypothetical protein
MNDKSAEYFRQREHAERAAAEKAASAAARRAHHDMAQEYAELLRQRSS